jgi:uncharacterized glyoxalase superfamily protein PhnB
MMAQLVASAWKIIPKFQSLSISDTVQFYKNELNFLVGSAYPSSGNSKGFCSVSIGRGAAANIYFFQCEAREFHPREAMIALGTAQLDEFYNLLMARGNVEILEPIGDKEWGYRQFTVKDNDGNALTFFRFLEGGNPGDEKNDE